MQIDERDALIRVEEQLKESAKNQSSIMTDLRDIFGKLERESKLSMILSGDLKSHLETSKIRWSEWGRRLELAEQQLRDLSKEITKETEDRKMYEQSMNSSLRTLKWIFGAIAGLIGLFSSVSGFIQFFKG